eukprot:10842694-Karenia_brevis.AAC.1
MSTHCLEDVPVSGHSAIGWPCMPESLSTPWAPWLGCSSDAGVWLLGALLRASCWTALSMLVQAHCMLLAAASWLVIERPPPAQWRTGCLNGPADESARLRRGLPA